jgi:pimeloyl-ACP methyl ester carboxylesterase
MVRWPESLCRQLADSGLYVIRYDNRDTGISTSYPPYAPPYTAVDLADDAVGILDAYSIQQAHTWGISLGGMIIQQLAINHPDRLLTATIMSSTPDPKAIGAAATGGGVTHTSLPGPTSVVIELIKILANIDWHDPAAAVEAWVTEDRMLMAPIRSTRPQVVSSPSSRSAGRTTSSATASTIPLLSTRPQAGVTGCQRFRYPP